MRKLMIKSTLGGFILGTLFFAIAPLGLGLSLIETLRPVLIPGVSLIQLVDINTVGSATLILALFLNGLIYSILMLSVLVVRSHLTKSE